MSRQNLIAKESLDIFLTRASFNLLMILYFLYFAHNSKKGFNVDNLTKKIPRIKKDIFVSIMNALRTIGLVEVNENASEEILTVIDIEDSLFPKLKNEIYRRATAYDSVNKPNEALSWANFIKQVESYF